MTTYMIYVPIITTIRLQEATLYTLLGKMCRLHFWENNEVFQTATWLYKKGCY